MSNAGWKKFERRVSRDHGVERQAVTGERDGSDSQERSGVYAIVNTVTDVAYIGCSVNMPKRYGQHRLHLRNGKHHNIYLQRAWDKYGAGAFELFVLQRLPADRLADAERFWLTAHWHSYNIADAGGRPPNIRGRKLSADTRALMSKNRRGISGSGFKLTAELAREIKALKPADWPCMGRYAKSPTKVVAARYGVHHVTIAGIWGGRHWINA